MAPSNGRNDGVAIGGSEDRTDEWLSLLADERRRRVLARLEEAEELRIDDLVRHLGVVTDGASEVDLSTSLYHVHLPKLSSAGLVEFDPEDGRVAKTDWPPLVDDLVRRLE